MSEWTRIWWWWLVFVALSWVCLEGDSIWRAWVAGQAHIQVWTLSDTIRRWSALHRWLMPVVTGTAVFLLCHFFYEQNR